MSLSTFARALQCLMRDFDVNVAYPLLASDEGPLFGNLGISIGDWAHRLPGLEAQLVRWN